MVRGIAEGICHCCLTSQFFHSLSTPGSAMSPKVHFCERRDAVPVRDATVKTFKQFLNHIKDF